jgi:predicted DNA-binding transcriptional regulator YafY
MGGRIVGMWETSGRLLRLLGLLQRRRDWTGPELAERLGITERTVRRDIDRLRELGYPVQARPGLGGGYRLGVGAEVPPLLLDGEEAVALVVALRDAARTGLAGIEESALSALAKVEQSLPSRYRHRVQLLQQAVVPLTGPGPQTDLDVLLVVAAAVRDHQRLRADYRRHDGTESRRTLEPHRIVHAGHVWYLLAWDLERADWRTLRLDRLAPVLPAGPRFTPRELPDPDPGRFTAAGITTNVYRYHCRATFHAAAEVVAASITPTIGVVTPVDATTCEVVCGSNSLDEVVLWFGLLDADFEVHEPPELRDRLKVLGRRLASAGAVSGPAPPPEKR